MALIPSGVGACFFMPFYGASTGQGTVTRLPQLTQVASRKYQTISYSSKVHITLKTCDPQVHTWTGPKPRRSAPKGLGRVYLDQSLGRVSRRNHIDGRLGASLPASVIRLTAHMVAIVGVANATTRR
jgi:hypothetical protein